MTVRPCAQISSKPGLGISYTIPPSSQHSQPAPQQASMMSMPSGSSGVDALLGAGPGVPRPASKHVDTPPFYHASAAGGASPGPNRFIDNDTTLFTNTSPSGYSGSQTPQPPGAIGVGGARGSPSVVPARPDQSLGTVVSSTRSGRSGRSGTRGQVMDREGLEEALDEIYDHRILFLGRFELYGQVRPHLPSLWLHRTSSCDSVQNRALSMLMRCATELCSCAQAHRSFTP